MVVLAMTAFLPDLNPPVPLDRSDNVPDLQGTSVAICWAPMGNPGQPSPAMKSVEIVANMGVVG